ncbi:phenylacetate-CoA ligase [Marinobacter antarcticus]|uniref:Phenylacetate-CoA ligase n=1 Tax=Marinobacter antarcticus TaxID=564117 RepID=A0A1M6SMZ8_9GAMM|nr:phenylacetate--CoA ligase family protein [Marinobacter antarcticus]SHK46121.1 phenylacetate-CoA ligase [Marinobacter antarcticus]
MNIKERIYYSSSPRVQNFLVSLTGRMQFPKRYENLDSKLREINEINTLSGREKTDYQNEKIESIVRFCGNNIPFYQRLFSDYGISHTQISSKADLQKMPVLSKRTIIDNIDSLIDPSARNYITQKTSGTTGTPFTIHMNRNTYELAMALLVDHEIQHGVDFGARRATFAGRLIKNYTDNNPPFFRFNKSENQAIFSTYHLSNKTLDHYDRELEMLNPEELIGYPSAIYNLATLYSENKKTPSFKPKIIITNSETLFSWQRSVIEKVFGCLIYDYYGTAEYILFAGQDKSFSYIVNPILGVHEIIDDQGLGSDSGQIIGTTLTNTVMPLIRYEIGDMASGCDNFAIKNITGRVDDQIHTPDGRRIGRTGEIFGFFENIKEAQIIQHRIDYCEILIVKLSESAYVPENQIMDKFHKKFGKDMIIKIEFVNNIEKSKNGKFKAVKSHIKGKKNGL